MVQSTVGLRTMRIRIDPNVRIENNWTFSGFSDVFGNVNELKPDDWVTAMWDETDQIFDAKVVCLDYEREIIDLAVDWSSIRDDKPLAAADNQSLDVRRAAARAAVAASKKTGRSVDPRVAELAGEGGTEIGGGR